MYAEVIVDIAISEVDRLYTYSLDFDAKIGQRVLVPFGKGDRTGEGFILGITDKAPEGDFKIKSVIRVLESYAAIDESQIELARWISKNYHCTMAQSLRLMIPAQLRGMRISEKKQRCVKLKDKETAKKYMDSLICKNGTIRSKAAFDTIDFLIQTDMCVAVSDLYSIISGCKSSTIKKLSDDEIIDIVYQTVYRKPKIIKSNISHAPILTDEQTKALEEIKCGIDSHEGTFLLHGVTGSGKTEVYMNSIEYALEKEKGAIVLVPEISLTPQTVSRFSQRFGDNVAVLHSRLSVGERFDEWRRIRLGEVKVVVGARSAVFAPVKDIGIIIIDEEHENSYFSETIPRYNALEVAQKRCRISGGVTVLGSATPSVTTYFKAKRGKIKLLELNTRINNKPLPKVEIVDMRSEFLNGNSGIFSNELAFRLDECYKRGEQAILFLNRRGYSSFVSCRACGYVFNCDECDVSLTYHKFENKLKCHYCGKEQKLPSACPNCKKPYIKYSGLGTQQIEEEVLRLLPNAKCIRMDADTTKGKDAHAKLLSEFDKGDAQILIGTQMIAKGLDFPNVTLVGIVSVDAMLAMPDFRNTERTFQLLTQVAGRAGRADKSGLVVLQTSRPDHPVIEYAQSHDYKSFYEYAIKSRFDNLYPPYSVFVRILFTGDDDETVKKDSVDFSNGVYDKMVDLIKEQQAQMEQILFIYAMPAPIRKIQNKQRHHILIKLARTKQTAKLIDCIYKYSDECNSKSLSQIEVNPIDML